MALLDWLKDNKKDRKEVALVLSTGGARGLAHIGAIDQLNEMGYHIHSVAGTSIGALIGGMYAAGRLEDFVNGFFLEYQSSNERRPYHQGDDGGDS